MRHVLVLVLLIGILAGSAGEAVASPATKHASSKTRKCKSAASPKKQKARKKPKCRRARHKKPARGSRPRPAPAPRPAPVPLDPCPLASPRTYEPIGTPSSATPNDPLFGAQWGLPMIGAPAAWSASTGKGTIIAIIDSGVDLHHPDLRANLVPGKDFVDGDSCPDDVHGHGTYTAGIAAAVTNNAVGVAGTAPAASIMPIRVTADGHVADTSNIDKAVQWAVDHGAKVINVSMSGPEAGVAVLADQPVEVMRYEHGADYAWSKGAVMIASAGNGNLPVCEKPAGTVRAICVSAVGRDGSPASYSNLPVSPENGVAVQAPGGDSLRDQDQWACYDPGAIWSTVPPGNTLPGPNYNCVDPPNAYAAYEGTSAAAPFVSGTAALLFSLGLSNEQVVARIRDTASNGGIYNPVTGYGIVNAAAAVGP